MQTVVTCNIVHGGANLMEECTGLAVCTIAVSIKEQIQLDAFFRKSLQGLLLHILQLPGGILAALQLVGSAVGKITPGEVNLINLRLVLADAVQQIPVSIF